MKRTKWILSLVLAFALMMGNFSVPSDAVMANAETGNEEYQYSILNDGTVVITRYNGTAKELVIPGEINGKRVTSIGNSAFMDYSGITSITIPKSVTSIGEGAFESCSGLTSITIPEGVTSIESFAFSGCSGITSIAIPEGVTSIGNYAFDDCTSLTSITISESVTSIGIEPFGGCTSLESISVASGNAVYDSRGDCDAIIKNKELVCGCKNTRFRKV